MSRDCFLTILAPFLGSAAAADPPDLCLGGLDPVALVAGGREAGLESMTAQHGRYQYRFASAEHRASFLEQPEKFVVQYSGACAKMGPLSGRGSPDRFAVHEGRIYLFASESCLASFQKAPASYVERDDPVPQPSVESSSRGRELLALALRGLGGEARVDAVQSVAIETQKSYRDGDQTRQHTAAWIAAFPHRVARTDAWHGAATSMVATPERGWYRGTRSTEALDDFERRWLRREARRIPLVLLKSRHERGFVAAAAGRGKAGDREVELLTVHLDGVSHTLGLEPQSGRVLSLGYRGRLSGPIVNVVKTYDDFRQAGGLVLPFAVAAGEAGKEPAAKSVFARVAVDEPIDAALFEPPR